MTKQMLSGIQVSSKEELADKIYKYFDELNQVPAPYHWSYNPNDIDLEKRTSVRLYMKTIKLPVNKIRIIRS